MVMACTPKIPPKRSRVSRLKRDGDERRPLQRRADHCCAARASGQSQAFLKHEPSIDVKSSVTNSHRGAFGWKAFGPPIDRQTATTLRDAAPSHRRYLSLALVERKNWM